MKNVMIIDGADNCAYDIFAMDEELFDIVFPDEGQNIEFIEDLTIRIFSIREMIDDLFEKTWARPVNKEKVQGIHGTLFYELKIKKKFYPNKKDSDLDSIGRASSTAKL